MPAEQFEGLLTHLNEAFSAENAIIATQEELPPNARTVLRVVPIPGRARHGRLKPADFIAAYEAGCEYEARAVLMLGPGADSLSPPALHGLADAVLNGHDLALPHYRIPPNTGLSIRRFFIRLRGRCSRRGRDFHWRRIWASRCAWRSAWPRQRRRFNAPIGTMRFCGL